MRHVKVFKIVVYLHLVIGLLGLGFTWLMLPPASAQGPVETPTPPFFGFNTVTTWYEL